MENWNWVSHDDYSKGDINISDDQNFQQDTKDVYRESITISELIDIMLKDDKKKTSGTGFAYGCIPINEIIAALDNIGISISEQTFVDKYNEQRDADPENKFHDISNNIFFWEYDTSKQIQACHEKLHGKRRSFSPRNHK